MDNLAQLAEFIRDAPSMPPALLSPVVRCIEAQRTRARVAVRLAAIWRMDYPELKRCCAAKAIAGELAELPRRQSRFNRFPSSMTPGEKRLASLPEKTPRRWRQISKFLAMTELQNHLQ